MTLAFLPQAGSVFAQWPEGHPAWARIAARFAPFGSLRALPSRSMEPGSWSVEAHAPWPLDGQKLLTSRGLKHTLRRSGPGCWTFDLPVPTLKKDWIRSLESRETEEGWVHRLVPGEKWDWRVFLEEGFAYPPEGGASRVRLAAAEGSLRLR